MHLSHRRLLIVEEALKDYTGHWYEYNRAVVEFNRKAGVDVTIAAHQSVSEKITRELAAIPLFQYTNWDGIYNSPLAWRRYLGILQHNLYVYRTMDRFLSKSDGYDCVFVPTVIIYHWIAWYWLMRKYQGRKFNRLVLFVRNNAGSYPNGATQPVFKRHTILLKKILQAYRYWVDNNTVCFGTDSARHASEYKKLSGLSLTVFPHPKVQLPVAVSKELNFQDSIVDNTPVVFSCLGPARLEKGADILQSAILHLLRTQPHLNAKFVIQWNRKILNEDGSLFNRSPELEQSENVVFLTHDLTSTEYETYLNRSDCIILPYRREPYYTRLSGIAIEAAMLGIPLIYTRDTWLEDAVTEYGSGLSIETENAQDLAEKIILMIDKLHQYKVDAQIKASQAQDYHSQENFLKYLWNL